MDNSKNSEPIIEFEKVKFSYSKQSSLVLDNFSMQIKKGEVTAVLGPNGTGKTTMLMLLLGWLVPEEGTVKVESKPLGDYTRSMLGKRVALVPQSEPISFEFSLLDFALLGRAPYLGHFAVPTPDDYKIASAALEKVGMGHKTNKLISEISGGEHQLVLLARALTQQTDIVLLDEPTSHLDIKNKSRLISILRELSADGKTIVFTTHEPDVASLIANSVIMTKNGRVIHSGPLDEVMTGDNLTEVYDTKIYVGECGSRKVYFWD